MRKSFTFCLIALAAGFLAGSPARAKLTDCEMHFTMSGWSVFYKTASGAGTITCDNGQTAKVSLSAKGGGLTAGKYKIRDGVGKFSEVADISELFGSYVESEAEAGAGKTSQAQALTKGEVSLALAGNGTGVNLGVSFGKFTITKQ